MMARITALGGEAWWLPSLEILPPRDETAWRRALAELPGCHWIIFTSPSAVRRAWPDIAARGGLPAGLRVATIGLGGQRELAAQGVEQVLTAAGQADSEALLALPELADMAGCTVMLVRGEGGREVLARTLEQRGARVVHGVCYRRSRPDTDVAALLAPWRQGRIHAVSVFSRDSLDGLLAQLGQEGAALLRRTHLFVPHQRIAEHARKLGILACHVTAPGEEGMMHALIQHYGHVHA